MCSSIHWPYIPFKTRVYKIQRDLHTPERASYVYWESACSQILFVRPYIHSKRRICKIKRPLRRPKRALFILKECLRYIYIHQCYIYSSIHWRKRHSKWSVCTIKRALHTLKWARDTLEAIHSKRGNKQAPQCTMYMFIMWMNMYMLIMWMNMYIVRCGACWTCSSSSHVHPCLDATGWRRLVGCLSCWSFATNHLPLITGLLCGKWLWR